MGALAQLVAPEEYLSMSFPDGDREFVDGVVVERNMGEKDHSTVQKRLILFLARLEEQLGWVVFPEQRIRLQTERYRIPDVCVYLGEAPDEQVFTTPPFLVIEVLSRSDAMIDVREKVSDYRSFGVPHVWIIDPQNRVALHYTQDGVEEVHDGVLRLSEPALELPLEDVLPPKK